MKIKIKIEADSGKDLRAGLIALLSDDFQAAISEAKPTEVDPTVTLKSEDLAVELERKRPSRAKTKVEPTVETAEDQTVEATPIVEEVAQEQPAATQEAIQTKTAQEAIVGSAVVEHTGAGNNVVTKEFLTPILIAKGREGKRPSVVELLTRFGAVNAKGEAGLPNLDPTKYAEFHDELIKL